MRRATIVQVHLGGELPSYLYAQLAQSRMLNPSEDVCLLLGGQGAHDRRAMEELGVRVYRLDRITPCENHQRFLKKNRFRKTDQGRFWRYAFERFLAMESFLEACPLSDLVHLENDVMLYARLSELLPALRSGRGGIRITMDSERRCIPGFVYVREAGDLRAMNEFLVDRSLRSRQNDMEALALYIREAGGQSCSALPVVPKGYREREGLRSGGGESGVEPWYDEYYEAFGGIFDAAALGQYLGGIDKIHNPGDTRGFVNETAVYDPRKMDLHWKTREGLRFPFGRVGETEFPVFNLHIHSKDLAAFSSKVEA